MEAVSLMAKLELLLMMLWMEFATSKRSRDGHIKVLVLDYFYLVSSAR